MPPPAPSRPPSGQSLSSSASSPHAVADEAPKKSRRPRKRTRRATALRRINGIARDRQGAWKEGGRSDLTDALTRKLRKEFATLRALDRADYAEGVPEGSPYSGRTARLGS